MRFPVELCFGSEVIYYVGLLLFSLLYLRYGKWRNKRI